MISIPDAGTDTAVPSDARRRSGLPRWLLVALALSTTLLSLLVVALVLVQLLRPAIVTARHQARRTACQGQVEQILQALFAYRNAQGKFPPAYTVDGQGKPLHSWRVLLLPYLGSKEQALYAQLKLDEPWDSTHNSPFATQIPSVYVCPDDRPFAVGDTSYCVVSGPQYAFRPQQGLEPEKVTDNPLHTLLIVEVHGSGINWMAPVDVQPAKLAHGVNSGLRGTCGSNHPRSIAIVGTADGNARALADSVGPDELHQMATVDGGELPRPPYVP
jgi:hypothetical protein